MDSLFGTTLEMDEAGPGAERLGLEVWGWRSGAGAGGLGLEVWRSGDGDRVKAMAETRARARPGRAGD